MNQQGIFNISRDNSLSSNFGKKLMQRNLSDDPYSHSRTFMDFKKQKHPLKKGLITEIEDYCKQSSLHGLRYIGDPNISTLERLFWLLAFLVAASCASYFISNIYLKWNQSPVIISFSPFDATMNDIPFPGITFCNMNQVNKGDAQKIIEEGPPVYQKLLNDFCNTNISVNGSINETRLDAVQEYLIHVGQSCSMVLRLCQWKSEQISCKENFNNELLDEGLCCSFNRLPPQIIMRDPKIISLLNQTYPEDIYDWTPEFGFSKKLQRSSKEIPRRPLGSGVHMGLTLVMDAQVDNVFCSSTMGVGFKILILNPLETPKMSNFGVFLSPGFESRIAITPVIKAATPSLRNVGIDKRACFYGSERKLMHYRAYSKNNCEFECQSNYTLSICDCVPFYLPHSLDVKVCEQKDEECVIRTQDEMSGASKEGKNCQCLPSCNEILYTFSQSFTKLVYNRLPFQTVNSSIADQEYFVKNIAVAHFYFENTEFTKVIKSEVFSFTDFLSNTGGLLGVFIGFSILSVFEMVYFVWSQIANFFRRKDQNKRIEQQRSRLWPKPRMSFLP